MVAGSAPIVTREVLSPCTVKPSMLPLLLVRVAELWILTLPFGT